MPEWKLPPLRDALMQAGNMTAEEADDWIEWAKEEVAEEPDWAIDLWP